MTKPSTPDTSRPLPGNSSAFHEWIGAWPLLRVILGGAFIIVMAFFAYLPALHGEFVWDDDLNLMGNVLVRSADGLRRIWFSAESLDYFPLTLTSFWIEWHLWGANTFGYHVSNILLHAAGALLLWRILCQLKIRASWASAVIFAVHPVCVASVAWITERKNTLSLVFYFLSLLLYLRFDSALRTNKSRSTSTTTPGTSTLLLSFYYWFSFFAFILAVLAKSSVVGLPLVLLLCLWWRHGTISRADIARVIPFFIAAVFFGLVTVWFQTFRAMTPEKTHPDHLLVRLLGGSWAVWFYFLKSLLPMELSAIYPRWEIDPTRWMNYLPAAAILGLLFLFFKYRKGWGRIGLFVAAYFVVALLPVLGFFNAAFFIYSRVADHWQYLAVIAPPTFLISSLAFVVGERFKRAPFLFWIPFTALTATFFVLTLQRAKVFSTVENLWRDTAKKNPTLWSPHNNLGICYIRQGKLDEGLAEMKIAAELRPDLVEPLCNIGAILAKKGELDEAMKYYRRAVLLRPDESLPHNNIGSVYLNKNQLKEALAEFSEALRLDSHFSDAHYNMGLVLMKLNRSQSALDHFREVIRFNPFAFTAHLGAGNALLSLGKTVEAEKEFAYVLEREPNNPEAHNFLGRLLASQGKYDLAVAQFQEAVRLAPGYFDPHYHLGDIFMTQGKLSEATAEYTAALQATPDFAPAHYKLGNLFLRQKNMDEALAHFSAAIKVQPDYAEAHHQFGILLLQGKQTFEGIVHLREAVKLKPEWLEALNNLAWALATQKEEKYRDGTDAVQFAERAFKQSEGKNAGVLDTLAAAYAEAGQFPAAVKTAQKAIEIAEAAGQKDLAKEIQERLGLYRSNKPYREIRK